MGSNARSRSFFRLLLFFSYAPQSPNRTGVHGLNQNSPNALVTFELRRTFVRSNASPVELGLTEGLQRTWATSQTGADVHQRRCKGSSLEAVPNQGKCKG